MKSYAAHRKSYYFIDLRYALKATKIKSKSKNKFGRGAFFLGAFSYARVETGDILHQNSYITNIL